MKYEGPESKIDWTGKTLIIPHPVHGYNEIVVMVETNEGVPILALAAGKLIPDNWVGKRVRVTVELLP
jgi:hypothetical protein